MDIKSLSEISRVDAAKRVTADEPRAETPARPKDGDAPADQVTLTPTARRLMDASQNASSAPPVDRARVDAIRSAIADGSYDVDAKAVAEKLLQTERNLPG